MTPQEAIAAVRYTNELDGRVTMTDARADLWARELARIPGTAVRSAILDYYAAPLPDGVLYRRPVEPFDIRRLAVAYSPDCEAHDGFKAARCPLCRDEVTAGVRTAEQLGVKLRPTPRGVMVSNVGRLKALLPGSTRPGDTTPSPKEKNE